MKIRLNLMYPYTKNLELLFLKMYEHKRIFTDVGRKRLKQTLGSPVLPLVYIMTATSSLAGNLGCAGFPFPSFSTSENDETVKWPMAAEKSELTGAPSSSK